MTEFSEPDWGSIMKQTQKDYEVNGIFPTPIYFAKRDSDLDSTEEKEVEDIIEEGMYKNDENFTTQVRRFIPSSNTYILNNTKLKKLKEFCDRHIDTYVKEVIATREELDFYITQSWLNIIKPGESLHHHSHSNSIISGVFYISTEEDDKIMFTDPNVKLKELIIFDQTEFNMWNSGTWTYPSKNNSLILFPAWLDHSAIQNLNATRDRISLAFNVFVRGKIGTQGKLSELVLR